MKKLNLFVISLLGACGPDYVESRKGVAVEIDAATDSSSIHMWASRRECTSRGFDPPDCRARSYGDVKVTLGSSTIELGAEFQTKQTQDIALWQESKQFAFSSSEGDFFRVDFPTLHLLDAENVTLERIENGSSRNDLTGKPITQFKVHLSVKLAELQEILSLGGGDAGVSFFIKFLTTAGNKVTENHHVTWLNGSSDLNHTFDLGENIANHESFQVCYSVGNTFGTESDKSILAVSVCSESFNYN